MISAIGLSRRGLLAGTAMLTACGASAAKQDRLTEGVVILIDRNEPYVMGHAISYSANLAKHFAERGARLLIEVVANGKGIDVFRADKTPLLEPLAALRQSLPELTYSMCASSKAIVDSVTCCISFLRASPTWTGARGARFVRCCSSRGC